MEIFLRGIELYDISEFLMAYKGSIPGVLCGIFVSVTTIADWFWNGSLASRPYSSAERYRYGMFLEPPDRILPPPDLPGAVICAAVMFFVGYVSATLIADVYRSRHTLCHGPYLKTATLAGLVSGLCAGAFVFANSQLLPLSWHIYFSVAAALIGFFITYLALLSLYRLHLWWKRAVIKM